MNSWGSACFTSLRTISCTVSKHETKFCLAESPTNFLSCDLPLSPCTDESADAYCPARQGDAKQITRESLLQYDQIHVFASLSNNRGCVDDIFSEITLGLIASSIYIRDLDSTRHFMYTYVNPDSIVQVISRPSWLIPTKHQRTPKLCPQQVFVKEGNAEPYRRYVLRVDSGLISPPALVEVAIPSTVDKSMNHY